MLTISRYLYKQNAKSCNELNKLLECDLFRFPQQNLTEGSALEEYIRYNNEDPKPFVWIKRAEDIIEKVAHCKAIIETLH
jgi:hypothetical protein